MHCPYKDENIFLQIYILLLKCINILHEIQTSIQEAECATK